MDMHHYCELMCGKKEKQRLKSMGTAHSSPHGRKETYYGKIMIYVNGRRDIRLGKGWRCEPIMINASKHTQPPYTLLKQKAPYAMTSGDDLQRLSFSSSLHSITALALLSICSTKLSCSLPCFPFISLFLANKFQPPTPSPLPFLLLSLSCALSIQRPELLPMMDSNDPSLLGTQSKAVTFKL